MRRLRIPLASAVALVAVACSSASPAPSAPPTASEPPPGAVTVALEATPSGSCCVVYTVNPGKELSVGCFVVVFDAGDRYVTTVLLPPKPAGHTRSSGFIAPAGRSSQGEFEIPLDLETGSYRTTCRPAAWHGGAPI